MIGMIQIVMLHKSNDMIWIDLKKKKIYDEGHTRRKLKENFLLDHYGIFILYIELNYDWKVSLILGK